MALTCAFFGCTQKEKKIEGRIEIHSSLEKQIKPTAVLYIIARNADQKQGPPVAVKRFTQPLSFPLEFNLSQRDVMLPDTPFQGEFSVQARISQNGSANPGQKGDIKGLSQPATVKLGSQDLKIVLDQIDL